MDEFRAGDPKKLSYSRTTHTIYDEINNYKNSEVTKTCIHSLLNAQGKTFNHQFVIRDKIMI